MEVYACLMARLSANCQLLECWLKEKEKEREREKQKAQSFPSLKVVYRKKIEEK